MGREELSRYTPEALAALANWGLVKRAQKELDEGFAPRLREEADELKFSFGDGVVTTFSVHRPPTESRCTCSAPGWCRHRVGSLLWLARERASSPSGEAAELEVDVGRLRQWLGTRLWQKAERLKSLGMVGELLDQPWRVALPQCDVKFLIPNDAFSWHCSCSQPSPCEHLAVAAWVVAERRGLPGRVEWSPAQATGAGHPLLDSFLDELIREGCLHGATSWKAWGKQVRRECSAATWLLLLLDRLEQLQTLYLEGSAHYQPSDWLFCLLSLKARIRSDSLARGIDLPLEQELAHVRLMSLGCRLKSRRLTQYWLEPGGQVLSQEQWLASEQEVVNLSWPGLGSVATVAVSQLVSRGVVRRANRSLRMRRERSYHSLTPLGRSWLGLAWNGVEAELRSRSRRAGRLLGPLLEAEDMVVMPIAAVESVSYAPGPQEVRAWVEEPLGGSLLMLRSHDEATPGALDFLVEKLGATSHVSGLLSWQHGVAVLEPLALLTSEGLCVLDLQGVGSAWELPLVVDELPLDPLQMLLQQALDLCIESSHLGLSQLMPSFVERRQQVCQKLSSLGMTRLSQCLAGSWNAGHFWPAAWGCFRACELLEGEAMVAANASP